METKKAHYLRYKLLSGIKNSFILKFSEWVKTLGSSLHKHISLGTKTRKEKKKKEKEKRK